MVKLNKALRNHALAVQKDWVIMPRLYAYLHETGANGALIAPEHMDRMVEIMAGAYNRSPGWHPSGLYTCKRAQVFEHLHMPPKEGQQSTDLTAIFIDGKWRHIKLGALLLVAEILYAVEVPVKDKKTGISGTIDGIGEPYHIYPEWIVDFKGTAQLDQIKKYGALPQHVQQLHGYFIALDRTDTGVVLYEDKATNQFHEVIVRRDSAVEREIIRLTDKLNLAVAYKELPEVLDECEHGEGVFKSCPYAYACKQVEWDEAEAAGRCSTSDQVIVKLGLSKRNKHKPSPPPSSPGGRGNPITVRFKSRVGLVSSSPTRKVRVTRG